MSVAELGIPSDLIFTKLFFSIKSNKILYIQITYGDELCIGILRCV